MYKTLSLRTCPMAAWERTKTQPEALQPVDPRDQPEEFVGLGIGTCAICWVSSLTYVRTTKEHCGQKYHHIQYRALWQWLTICYRKNDHSFILSFPSNNMVDPVRYLSWCNAHFTYPGIDCEIPRAFQRSTSNVKSKGQKTRRMVPALVLLADSHGLVCISKCSGTL